MTPVSPAAAQPFVGQGECCLGCRLSTRRGYRCGHEAAQAATQPTGIIPEPSPHAFSKQILTTGEPGGDGTLRPGQLAGRFLASQPFEFAEDDRKPIFLGQAIDLVVQNAQQLVASPFRLIGDRDAIDDCPLSKAAQIALGPGLLGDAVADSVEPAAQRFVDSQRMGFPHEDQEARLKGIFDVVRIGQDASAY